DQVGPIVEGLVQNGITGFYVCGSTGEGPSLTTEERRATAEAYVEATGGRVPVIVQVGHNSVAEARGLACHAQAIGADAISAVPPSYFKIGTLETMIDCFVEIASGAPELPFYCYHICKLTGVDFDMVEFLRLGSERIGNLAGIKYSSVTVYELQACLEYQDGRFDILFGCDEMLTSGLSVGVCGFVGSTYNFAAPLYRRIIENFQKGNLEEARKGQALSVAMVRILSRYRDQAGIKATMKLIGLDCGPNRLPHKTLTAQEISAMKRELEEIGFFEWAVKPNVK
ncbi:MAG: dihydrodipicolinate synthase family protein, partial [Sedimentisphaerales bacterium]|nr:dihydrodipicolinate synthase family protein [Sedimentisphaerales bacterium]